MLAMRMQGVMVALLWLWAAGCFEPKYQEGITCSEAMTCPPGLTCNLFDNRCWSRPMFECREDGDCTKGVCDESSGRCVEPSGSCGDGLVNAAAGEVCDPGRDTCCATTCDALASVDTTCRPSLGPCDPAEACTGESPACPPDELAPATTVCHLSAGPCDPAETCTGASPICPPDEFAPATTVCHPGAGICDPAELCDGASPTCPADAILPDGRPCGDCASGQCDACMAGACTDLCGNGVVDTGAGEQCETGNDAACPGQCNSACLCNQPRSCLEYLALVPGLASGIYTIDFDGAGTEAAPFEVYCDMSTDGGGWTRVFHEDTRNGSFFPIDAFELNKNDPEADLYAILNDLERFRRNGEFELLMRWPGHTTFTADQRWAQTSNPVTDSPGAIPLGYRPISISYTSNGWSAGLQRSLTPDSSLLDGTMAPLSNWYYAVGTTYCWGNPSSGCQPAPSGGAHAVELFVR